MSELSLFYSLISSHSQCSWYLWTRGRVKYNNSTERRVLPSFSPLSVYCWAYFLISWTAVNLFFFFFFLAFYWLEACIVRLPTVCGWMKQLKWVFFLEMWEQYVSRSIHPQQICFFPMGEVFFFSTPVLPHCVCQKECPVLVIQPRFEKDNVLVRFISLTCCLCCHQSRDWFLFFLKKNTQS